MAVDAFAWAFDQRVEPTAKLVLLVIADNEGADRKCWVNNVERAAARASIPAESWDAYTILLASLGFIKYRGHDRPPGAPPSTSARYYVLAR